MKIIIFIIFLVSVLGGFLLLGFMHEQVHVEIFKSYGISSHIEYFSHFPDFVTIANNSTENCKDSCKMSHDINEAITYPLEVFFILFSGLFLIFMIYAQEILNKLEYIE